MDKEIAIDNSLIALPNPVTSSMKSGSKSLKMT